MAGQGEKLAVWDATLRLLQDLWPLAALFGLFGLWGMVRHHRSHSGQLSREFRSNVAWYFFDGLFVVPTVIGVIGASAALVSSTGLRGALIGPFITDWNVAAQFVVAVFVSDLVGYWRHRLLHHPWFWPSHAVHHSDVAVHWLTLVRIHPTERWANAAFDTVFLALCGFPPEIVVTNNLLRHYYGYWLHCDFRGNYGVLRHVFVSPGFHRWHHATERAARDKNFAVIFSCIDRLFGSFYLPNERATRFGLGPDSQPVPFHSQMLMPFVLWGQALGRSSRGGSRPATAGRQRDA